MNNQAVATQAKTTSAPVNGAEEPPPHPGFDVAGAPPMSAPTRMFDPGERSQATQIEQARAVAEVQAAIVVAQNRPRDMSRALEEMRKVCTIEMMADRAFSSFPKGGATVSMGSIHLARELARIWGNISYGSKELARNDAKGESEMMAYAWDLQTNARPETTFIVPHVIDLSGGRKKKLTDARSVYENNANMAARRMRVQIFAVIPRWFTDEAEDLCRRTLELGGGKPIKERVDEAVKVMAQIGVTPAMIEKKFGCSMVTLNSGHLADLRIIYRSIKNGEIEKDEAFPETPAADVDKALRDKAAAAPKPEPAHAAPPQQSQEAPQTGQQAVQTPQTPPDHSATVTVILDKITKIGTAKGLDNLIAATFAEDLDLLRTEAPVEYERIQVAIKDRRAWFARP